MVFDVEGENFPEHCIALCNRSNTQSVQEVQWDNGHSTSHVTQNLHVSTSTVQIIVHIINYRAKITYISCIKWITFGDYSNIKLYYIMLCVHTLKTWRGYLLRIEVSTRKSLAIHIRSHYKRTYFIQSWIISRILVNSLGFWHAGVDVLLRHGRNSVSVFQYFVLLYFVHDK
jgi:hypothetical protein